MNYVRYLDGLFAQLACLWEVTARKPGNVHRFKDFEDTSYLDFVSSAAALVPILSGTPERSVGDTVFECVTATSVFSGKNTNLGIILLLAPLTKASTEPNYAANVAKVLDELTVGDAVMTYTAIQLANPGGLGEVKDHDVRKRPTITLREAMALAAHRDTIALQYTNGFREVFHDAAPTILHGIQRTGCIEGGIIHAHLHLMSRYPDTLIARKRGVAEAEQAAQRAQWVLDLGWPHSPDSRAEFADFDDWLRAEGNSRNPGTTADLIAAALFVLLRTDQLSPRPKDPWALPPSLLP
jgi:triphosphoribosyl-dephospho-CoA synthase